MNQGFDLSCQGNLGWCGKLTWFVGGIEEVCPN